MLNLHNFVQPLSNKKPRSDAWLLAHPLLHVFPMTAALLALFAPVDILDRAPWLAVWCGRVIEWFPFLGKHAAVSVYPQVTTLVMCVSWALLLPSVLGASSVFWSFRYRALERIQLNLSKLPPWRHFAFSIFLM